MNAGAPARVALATLRLSEFRNYASLALTLRPGAVVFTGENGAGKTNLLEAISFLSPGRGLRRAAYEDVSRAGSGSGFAVHAEIEGPYGLADVGTGTAGNAAGEAGRRVRINGAAARSVDDLLEWVRVVWLVPSMDMLFTGPAAERRRFLDRLVLAVDPLHGQRALDYEKAMRGRNRLLADGVRDGSWHTAIEQQMAETGTAIAAARVELVRLLSSMGERLPDDGPFPKAALSLAGTLEGLVGEGAASDAEEWFRRALAAGRDRDAAAGRTLDGPHRADLSVTHVPKAMEAARCSTGEQKALLTGLVLAHARLSADLSGQRPILLLDEIAAHFDDSRRTALFSILHDIGCQTFMTGTEPDLFRALHGQAQFLTVSSGRVAETS